MKRFIKYLFTTLGVCLACAILGVLFVIISDNGLDGIKDVEINSDTLKEYLQNSIVLIAVGVGALFTTLMFLSGSASAKKDSNTSDAKVKERGDVKKYYDTNWVSAKELRSNTSDFSIPPIHIFLLKKTIFCMLSPFNTYFPYILNSHHTLLFHQFFEQHHVLTILLYHIIFL